MKMVFHKAMVSLGTIGRKAAPEQDEWDKKRECMT
jgi:hypothetical protein